MFPTATDYLLKRLPAFVVAMGLFMPFLLCNNPAQAVSVHSEARPLYNINHSLKESAYYDLHVASPYLSQGEYSRALPYLVRASEKMPNSLIALFDLATCYATLAETTGDKPQKKFFEGEAERLFLRVQSLNPELTMTYFKLGKLALARNDYQAARDYYEAGLGQHPDNAVLHFNLASVYERLEDWDGAIRHYRESIRNNPDFVYAYNNLGLVYEQQKNIVGAEAMYTQALAKDPAYTFARLNLGNLFADRGDHARAMDTYREALRYEPTNSWAYLYLGNELVQMKEYVQAAEAYQACLKNNPRYVTAYYLLAMVLNRLNRWEEAMKMSRAYVQLAPNGDHVGEMQQLFAALKDRKTDTSLASP